MSDWIQAHADAIAGRAPRELEALVAVSSPSGDRHAAEEAAAVAAALAPDDPQPLRREDDRLVGSGTIDMKGGDVLALGVLRALAHRRGDFAEAALLLVCDEEWRTAPFGHAARFAGWDACLCF